MFILLPWNWCCFSKRLRKSRLAFPTLIMRCNCPVLPSIGCLLSETVFAVVLIICRPQATIKLLMFMRWYLAIRTDRCAPSLWHSPVFWNSVSRPTRSTQYLGFTFVFQELHFHCSFEPRVAHFWQVCLWILLLVLSVIALRYQNQGSGSPCPSS